MPTHEVKCSSSVSCHGSPVIIFAVAHISHLTLTLPSPIIPHHDQNSHLTRVTTRQASTPPLFQNKTKRSHHQTKMASHQRATSSAAPGRSTTGMREKTYFEQQREELIGEIAMVCTPSPGAPPRAIGSLATPQTELRTRPRQHQQAESLARGGYYRLSPLLSPSPLPPCSDADC